MAKQVQLKASKRSESGRGPVKRLRATGVVPGVVYGPHTEPVIVTVSKVALSDVLAHAVGGNVLVDLQVEEGGKTVQRLTLIQDVQKHPCTDVILHVDFREVSATEKMRTTVAVRPVGEPEGVKTGGGVLEFIMRDLHVECLPKDLPDVIEVNVEKMEIGQSIHVSDITPPAGVTLLDQKGQAVFIVAAPIAEEVEAVPAAGAAAGEPEVIGAKKAEGEEGVEGEKKAEAGKPAAAGKAEAKPAAGKADAKAAPATAAKPEAKKK
jgi:large subunit ribosomal protein L25